MTVRFLHYLPHEPVEGNLDTCKERVGRRHGDVVELNGTRIPKCTFGEIWWQVGFEQFCFPLL